MNTPEAALVFVLAVGTVCAAVHTIGKSFGIW